MNEFKGKFNLFQSKLEAALPGFKVKYKNESLFMKIIGKLLFFNPRFMIDYTTTIGKTVYFPNRESVENLNEYRSITILAHEYVHAKDADKISLFLFSLLYLFPQIKAPFMLLLLPFFPWLSLGLFIFFLLPLPAPWRTYFEIRGYTMTLFILNEIYKNRKMSKEQRVRILKDHVNKINKHFTSFDYYVMWIFGVESKLYKKVEDIVSEKIFNESSIYKDVKIALKESNIINV